MKKLLLLSAISIFTVNSYGSCIKVVSQSVSVNSNNQSLGFHIVFDRPPDFFAHDDSGKQADTFQYNINTDNILPFSWSRDTDVVIRGGEINKEGDILIRHRGLPDDDGSGGWGGVAGRVPFVLNGSDLTFSASFTLIDPDGLFSYALETTEFEAWGKQTIWAQTPEPATVLLLGVGVPIVSGLRRKQTRRETAGGIRLTYGE
ncbi:MAG: PEP-CTERM sorting domain-containing protein [Sedimentisphaerales bacterium]